MRRYSVYLLFSLLVIASYILLDIQLGYRLWTEEYRQEFAIKVDRLQDEAFLAKALLRATDSSEKLNELLESRLRGRNIDFWILYHRDEVYKTNLEPRQLRALEIAPADLAKKDSLQMLDGANHSFFVSDLQPSLTLVVGKTYDLDRYLKYQFDRRLGSVLKDILLACLASILIFAYFFRDIVKSIRLLSGTGRRNFGGLRVHSKEAEMIVRGLSAYEDQATQLAMEKDILSWQVLPALRTELMSGRKPPYDFRCTMVRTDINNFSSIYNEFPVDAFTSTINDFFTDVTHVVSRYGGLIHEFIGDEVIFYFKDEDVGNSVAIAVSAVRDINEIATQYNQRTLKERGYGFTVKSSLADGSVQFRRFVNGFNMAGAVLIETVRILSHVSEKGENSLIFNERHVSKLEDVAHTTFFAKVNLKGYQDEQSLAIYKQHANLSALLAALLYSVDDSMVARLTYYRSDSDLVEILAWLNVAVLKGRYVLAQQVLNVMRSYRVTSADLAVSITLAEWIESLLSRIDRVPAVDRAAHLQLLSSAIRLIENLLPRAQFDERFEALCRQAASVKDRRLIANALDVLTLMKAHVEPEFSKALLEHEDNRVVANALVFEGSKGVSPLVLKRLRKLLAMKEAKFVASGLYALGEIAMIHRERDPIYYQAQIGLLTIIASLPTYVSISGSGENEMIRRQAMMAARKIANEKILDEMRERVRLARSPSLEAEAKLYLDVPSTSKNVTELASWRKSA